MSYAIRYDSAQHLVQIADDSGVTDWDTPLGMCLMLILLGRDDIRLVLQEWVLRHRSSDGCGDAGLEP